MVNLDGEPDGVTRFLCSQPQDTRTTENSNQPTWNGDAEFNKPVLQYFSLGRVFLIRQEKGNIYAHMLLGTQSCLQFHKQAYRCDFESEMVENETPGNVNEKKKGMFGGEFQY